MHCVAAVMSCSTSIPAKAGKVVRVGDHITIITDPLPTEEAQELTYEILEVPKGNVSKTRATTLYRRVEEQI